MPLNNPLSWNWGTIGFGQWQWTGIIQNDWYSISGNVGFRGNLKFAFLRVKQENTEAAAADLEVRVTIDDAVPMTLAIPDALSGDWTTICLDYNARTLGNLDGDRHFFNYMDADNSEVLDCSYINVEIRQTSAVGTVPKLTVECSCSREVTGI